MKIIAIIPARMGSSRFPDKPMAKLHGMPMIGHCYLRTKMSRTLMETYVATCDQEIFDYIRSLGGKAVMTSDKHERATDRTTEAMLKIEAELGETVDVVAMVQGDEPMVVPEMVEDAISSFVKDSSVQVVNLMGALKSVRELEDPNIVKVVVDKVDNALYFSRSPIPYRKNNANQVQMRKQFGIIFFRRNYLIKFGEMTQTPLEIIESVDMMRILENGEKVKMVLVNSAAFSVDTKDDLLRVEEYMVNDKLMDQYLPGRSK